VTTLVALVILVIFSAFEGRVRVGQEARSLRAGAADRGTTRRLGAAYGFSFVAVALSPLLNARGIAVLPRAVGWFGVGLMLVTLPVGLWAVRSLGASYTRTLRTSAGQALVATGPYRLIRHPGYAAGIARCIGAGLATTNGLLAAAICVVVVAAYHARITAEEGMLLDAFGDQYRAYARRTWRLLPPVY
jgi:protein-S-isoprenylcysteine O-methyltransferase